MRKTTKIKKTSVFFIIVCVFLILYVISLMVPLLWAVMTSFKSRGDYIKNTMGFPREIKWSNYQVAVQYFVVKFDTYKVTIGPMIFNSVVDAVGCSLAVTLGNCVTAYCCSKFSKFKITGVYRAIVIIALGLPIVGSEASSLQIFKSLGIYDNLPGLIFANIRFLGMYYLIFLAAFNAIPKDYSEAAYIDGAGNFTVFVKLMLPFVSKMFTTIVLIHFIMFWNDYQTPLLYLPTHPTLSYGLFKYSNSYEVAISSTPMKMAGCMILFFPIFVIFCIFQKRLLGNVMVGGVKE